MTFGQRLKILRIHKSSKLTQEDVACDIGVPRATYGNWETDRSTPDFEYLIKIADYYDVSIDYLLGRDSLEKKDRLATDTKSHTLANEINELPEEKRKMIEAMKSEQESRDGIKNNVSFLDQ